MFWPRRLLVLAPVALFIGSAILLSCGGGSSGTSPTPTPTVLVGVTGMLRRATDRNSGRDGDADAQWIANENTVFNQDADALVQRHRARPGHFDAAGLWATSLQLNAQGIFTRPSKPGQRAYRDITPPNGGALFFANNGWSQMYRAGVFQCQQWRVYRHGHRMLLRRRRPMARFLARRLASMSMVRRIATVLRPTLTPTLRGFTGGLWTRCGCSGGRSK